MMGLAASDADRDAAWPALACVDGEDVLVARGAQQRWWFSTDVSAADTLAQVRAAARDGFVVGATRFAPTTTPSPAWASLGGALWFSPRVLDFVPRATLAAAAPSTTTRVDVIDVDGERFRQSVAVADALLRHGAIEKVVLARRFRVPLPGASSQVPAWLSRLCRADGGFPFCFRIGPDFAWLGQSPERLLMVDDGAVTTEAVAGTRAVHDDEAAAAWSLQRSEKDAREHVVVVDHLVEALRAAGLSAEASARGLRRVGGLLHLHTLVRGSSTGLVDVTALLRALHPTPALAGRPTAAAQEALRSLEGFDRGGYGGVVGFCGPRRTSLSVALRGVLVDDEGLLVTVGAGIVRGSIVDDEDHETRCKARAVLASLGLVGVGL